MDFFELGFMRKEQSYENSVTGILSRVLPIAEQANLF